MLQQNIRLEKATVLVTGAAGFVGANLVMELLRTVPGVRVVGLDNLNDYYDVSIKEYRLREIERVARECAVARVGCEDAQCGAQSAATVGCVSSAADGVAVVGCGGLQSDAKGGGGSAVGGCEAEFGGSVAGGCVSFAADGCGGAWEFVRGSIADRALVDELFERYHFSVVVNLAAQAGVRYSITNPDVYIESNIIGFYNILEACRATMKTDHPVEHLVYASSSSVYGSNKKIPYSTDDKVDNPVSLYAATKKSNELMAHAYSKLYNIPSTGLRFFTVYGPAGRPDMAYFGFTNKLLRGETIEIFNYGNCKRDFTFVDDIVEGVKRIMQCAPERKNGEDGLPIPPYRVYNIGNNSPENLLDFVTILQEELVRAGVLPEDYDFEAHKRLVPMQAGDVPITYADTSALEADFGFKPSTSLRAGLRSFAEWYKKFYKV